MTTYVTLFPIGRASDSGIAGVGAITASEPVAAISKPWWPQRLPLRTILSGDAAELFDTTLHEDLAAELGYKVSERTGPAGPTTIGAIARSIAAHMIDHTPLGPEATAYAISVLPRTCPHRSRDIRHLAVCAATWKLDRLTELVRFAAPGSDSARYAMAFLRRRVEDTVDDRLDLKEICTTKFAHARKDLRAHLRDALRAVLPSCVVLYCRDYTPSGGAPAPPTPAQRSTEQVLGAIRALFFDEMISPRVNGTAAWHVWPGHVVSSEDLGKHVYQVIGSLPRGTVPNITIARRAPPETLEMLGAYLSVVQAPKPGSGTVNAVDDPLTFGLPQLRGFFKSHFGAQPNRLRDLGGAAASYVKEILSLEDGSRSARSNEIRVELRAMLDTRKLPPRTLAASVQSLEEYLRAEVHSNGAHPCPRTPVC